MADRPRPGGRRRRPRRPAGRDRMQPAWATGGSTPSAAGWPGSRPGRGSSATRRSPRTAPDFALMGSRGGRALGGRRRAGAADRAAAGRQHDRAACRCCGPCCAATASSGCGTTRRALDELARAARTGRRPCCWSRLPPAGRRARAGRPAPGQRRRGRHAPGPCRGLARPGRAVAGRDAARRLDRRRSPGRRWRSCGPGGSRLLDQRPGPRGGGPDGRAPGRHAAARGSSPGPLGCGRCSPTRSRSSRSRRCWSSPVPTSPWTTPPAPRRSSGRPDSSAAARPRHPARAGRELGSKLDKILGAPSARRR